MERVATTINTAAAAWARQLKVIRLGLMSTNPVKGVAIFRESNQRVAYLTADEEAAIRDALPAELRPHFTVSVHTGLRWSEHMQPGGRTSTC